MHQTLNLGNTGRYRVGVLTKYGESRKVHSAYNERRSAQSTHGGSNPLIAEPEWNVTRVAINGV